MTDFKYFSRASLMYGAEDPSIAGMVLDSPFSDLVDLMMELVDTYKIRLPKFTVSRLYEDVSDVFFVWCVRPSYILAHVLVSLSI